MKQILFEACTYYLSTPTVWRRLDKLWAQDISFKNGCFTDLAKNTATTQWYTCFQAISKQEHIQIFWNLESANLWYHKNLL